MTKPTGLPFFVSGEDRSHLGQIESVLTDVGRSLSFAKPSGRSSDVGFSPGKFAGLIILGGTKFYKRNREWLATAMNTRRPILGVCCGAQLLAAYLTEINGEGALKNDLKGHARIVEVELRGEGPTDPVMEPLRRSSLAIMCHDDCFLEPPGATALAWSTDQNPEHCEAFRVGRPEDAVYGVQFHPEPDLKMLEDEDWFEVPPDAKSKREAVDTGRSVLEQWVRLAIRRT